MDNSHLPQVAQRMFGTPLLIEPGKAEIIARAYGPRLLGSGLSVSVVSDDHGQADTWARRAEPSAGSILREGLSDYLIEKRAGYIKHQGVAVIEVLNTLVRRGSWVGQSSGMTSYEGLRAQLKAAATDSDMKAIALEFDSPGGEAAGCFELGDLIRDIRATKPVYGFCAEYAYSAAYVMASQCDYLTVPEFGGAGSIGVIMMHMDQSGWFDKQGLTVTVIRAGKHKAEGNSAEPLPPELYEEWKAECEAMRVSFAQLVCKGRGDRLSMADALKTEAKAFNGKDAVRLGLADKIANPKEAFDAMVASVNERGAWDGTIPDRSARLTISSSGCDNPEAAASQTKEADMAPKDTAPDKSQDAGDVETKDKGKSQTSPQSDAPDMTAPADAGAITKMVARAGLTAEFAAGLIEKQVTHQAASDAIIDKLAEKSAGTDGGDIRNIEITGDGVDRMKAGMVEALSAKGNIKGGKRNEFSSMSLREMARCTLTTRGLTGNFRTAQEMIGAAFVPTMAGGLHSTSDFGEVLADVANKAMLMGYEEAPETFELWTKRGTLTDFKPTKRVGTGLFPGLEEVGEGAEFTFGTMGDFSETILLATYGKLFAISRQAIINDDLGAFTDNPNKMGRAAKRTLGSLVYAVLNTPPNMSDGAPLFHASHGNLASLGAAPSEASIDAALTAMAQQKPRATDDEDASLNIQPKYLLASYTQRSRVLAALMSEKTPDSTGDKSSQRYNTVYKAAEPIFDSRISGNSWFMAADPAQFDTIEVAYLDGVSEPFIEQQAGWEVDGTEFKVRLDAGVAPNAWEGLYKNPGQ